MDLRLFQLGKILFIYLFIILPWCVCVCGGCCVAWCRHVCVCRYAHPGSPVHTHAEARWVSLICSAFFRRSLSLNPEHHYLVSLDDSKPQNSLVSTFPGHTGVCCHSQLFKWELGIELKANQDLSGCHTYTVNTLTYSAQPSQQFSAQI